MFYGKKTKLKILLAEISHIEKCSTAILFDNAIKITLKDNMVLTLHSFLSRDDCF